MSNNDLHDIFNDDPNKPMSRDEVIQDFEDTNTGVNYDVRVTVLIRLCKELQTENESLQAQLNDAHQSLDFHRRIKTQDNE